MLSFTGKSNSLIHAIYCLLITDNLISRSAHCAYYRYFFRFQSFLHQYSILCCINVLSFSNTISFCIFSNKVTEGTPKLEKLFKGSPRSPVTIINKPIPEFDINSLLTFTTDEPPTTNVAKETSTQSLPPLASAPPAAPKMNTYAVNKDNIQKYGDVISEMKMKNGKRLPSQKVEMKVPSNTWFKIEPQSKSSPQVAQPNPKPPIVPVVENVAKVENTNISGIIDSSVPIIVDQNKTQDLSQSNLITGINPVHSFPDPLSTNIESTTDTQYQNVPEAPIPLPHEQYQQEIKKMESSLEIQRVEEIAQTQLKQLESEITSQEYLSRSMESNQLEQTQSEFTKTQLVKSMQEEIQFQQTSQTLDCYQTMQTNEMKDFEQIANTQSQTLFEIQKMEENFEQIIQSNNVQESVHLEQSGLKSEFNSNFSKEFDNLTSDLPLQASEPLRNTVWQPPIMTTTNHPRSNQPEFHTPGYKSSIGTSEVTQNTFSTENETSSNLGQPKTYKFEQAHSELNVSNDGLSNFSSDKIHQENNPIQSRTTAVTRDNISFDNSSYHNSNYGPRLSATSTYFPTPFQTASSPVDFVDHPINPGFQTASSPIDTSEVFEYPSYGSFNQFEPSNFQSYSTQNDGYRQQEVYNQQFTNRKMNQPYVERLESFATQNQYVGGSNRAQKRDYHASSEYYDNDETNSVTQQSYQNSKTSTGLKSADLLLSSSFKEVSSTSQPNTKVEKVIKLDTSEDASKYSEIAKNIHLDFKPVERAHVKEVGHEYLITPRPQSIALDEEVRGLCEKSYVSAYEYQVYEEDKSSSVTSLTETSKNGIYKSNGDQYYSSNHIASNGISQVDYTHTKKPAELVPGAVPIFGGAILGFKPNESPKLQRKTVNPHETTKRPFYEIMDVSSLPTLSAPFTTIMEEPIADFMNKPLETKPPQTLPHRQVMKIRQEEIEPKKQNKIDQSHNERSLVSKFLNQSEDINEDYETIPVKSLIDCFEQTTRPVMKFKHVQEQLPELPKKQVGQINGISEGGFQPYARTEKSDTVFVCNTTLQQHYYNPVQATSYQEPTGYKIEQENPMPNRNIVEPYHDHTSESFQGYQSSQQNLHETESVTQTEEERRHIHEENKKIVHEIEERKDEEFKSLLTTSTKSFYTKMGEEQGKKLQYILKFECDL